MSRVQGYAYGCGPGVGLHDARVMPATTQMEYRRARGLLGSLAIGAAGDLIESHPEGRDLALEHRALPADDAAARDLCWQHPIRMIASRLGCPST